MGGIQAANSYVKVNLSLFDLYPREDCPSIPPEIMLFGKFIYQMSSWTRAIVIPLSIVHSMNPRRPVPEGFNLKELFLVGGHPEFPRSRESFTWGNVFLRLDKVLKLWEKHGPKSIRRRAIHKAEHWMLGRTRYSDGVAAIYPPMMYVIMALDLLGYGPDHPDRVEAQKQFDGLMVDDGDRFFFQPCFSVVWDAAIAAFALGEASEPPRDALRRCADWLLTRTRCSIRLARTSPAACSRLCARTDWINRILRFARASNTSCALRKRTEAGTAAGASTTCTVRSLLCVGWLRQVSAIAKPTYSAHSNGCVPFKISTAAGARVARVINRLRTFKRRALHRRQLGPFLRCWPAATQPA